MVQINFQQIEKKWQKLWKKEKIFEVSEKSKKPKYYVLEQFPYPSGSGLHVGHAFIYTIGDIYARYKRMNGFNVLYPMGYDSLGLPAENAAIKVGIHPEKYTNDSIKYFSKQQKALGLSYDWNRVFSTHEPSYYKWDQWIFLKMFEKDLVYQRKSPVNWCPKCNSVLANEQVHSGNCWIHNTKVKLKHLNQWYFKITEYAEELADFDSVKEWPDLIKKLQKNWIGKSYGTEIDFVIENEKWPVFTTRPDTIYGVTFLVISAQHPRLMEIVISSQKKEVEEFVKKLSSVSQEDIEQLEKEGVFTGSYATNPVNNEKIPVYAGNFVLADYGSGMIMAVPAHDQRDFEFAKKYNLPIKTVIKPLDKDDFTIILHDNDFSDIAEEIRKLANYNEQVSPNEKSYSLKKETKSFINKYLDNKNLINNSNNFIIRYPHSKEILELTGAFIGEGILFNSGKFNGLKNRDAIDEITKFLEKIKKGRKKIQYKLKDWLISRQRYWGTPIPIVHCEKCGIVPVLEKNLPVILPKKVKFGKGNPLETSEKWKTTKCPRCNQKAKRETDTMDTFVNSSWYYLRYCDSKNDKNIFEPKKVDYWIPIDIYIGGKEHACMHDIYIRFYTKFLRDLGLIKISEPANKLFVQGMVHGEDGNKMSKSLGNVIDPMSIIEKYGADSLRLFLVSTASPDSDFNWSGKGIQTSHKFISKFFNNVRKLKIGNSSKRLESKLNKTIKEVSEEIMIFKYNLAVIKLRSLLDVFIEEREVSKKDIENYLKLVNVFCPHMTEELWEKIGNKKFISNEKWPAPDESKIDEKFEKQEQIINNTISDIINILKIIREKQGREAGKIYLYVMPNEKDFYNTEALKKKIGKEIKVFSVNDKEKYDPENKSKKAKPSKPGIFVE